MFFLCARNQRSLTISCVSRLNFGFTLLSKRKLQWFVDKGLVSGWDDPAFPTLQGFLRRGLTMQALREFVKSQGASERIVTMEIEQLWALNKRIIDPIVPRYTAINKAGAVPLTLTNAPAEVSVKSQPKHRKNPDLVRVDYLCVPHTLCLCCVWQ